MISLANEYNQKIARLNQKQNEESALIDAVREQAFSAFDAVKDKGGTIPENPDDRKLGTALNGAIESIKTDHFPIDEHSELLYFGCDENGKTYFSNDKDDETDLVFVRDTYGLYGKNRGEEEESND